MYSLYRVAVGNGAIGLNVGDESASFELVFAVDGLDMLLAVVDTYLRRRALQHGLFGGDDAGAVEISQYLAADGLEVLHVGLTGSRQHRDQGR